MLNFVWGSLYIICSGFLDYKGYFQFNIRQIFTSPFLRRNLLLYQVYCLDAGVYCRSLNENDTPWLPSNK